MKEFERPKVIFDSFIVQDIVTESGEGPKDVLKSVQRLQAFQALKSFSEDDNGD